MKDIFENYEVRIARGSISEVRNISDVINNTSTSNETTILSNGLKGKYMDDYNESQYGINMMWTITILISFIVWIVCVVSLVLNIVRKNIGKAIFSGIGILVPIIACIMSSSGRAMAYSEISVGAIWVFIALLMQIITLIVSFIFCFSKKKTTNK